MLTFKKALSSTLGRKFLMAASGLLLVLFLIGHLAGNLTLLAPTGAPFNAYAQGMSDLGVLVNIAEFGLITLALVHIVQAVRLRMLARSARPVGYSKIESKMGPSKMGFASRTLIITGLTILVFLVLHIKNFKYGPGIEDGYATQLAGREVKDLHRWVVESFQNPLYAAFYVIVMIMIGFHLKHGIWSAFQSLGLTNSRNSTTIYRAGIVFAILLMGGFALIPVWIYFNVPALFQGGGLQ